MTQKGACGFAGKQAAKETTVAVSFDFRHVSDFESDLRSRICVKSPYNQLLQLAPDGSDGVSASIYFESEAGVEVDALASAEVGRHLAILGSCALARNNRSPLRHFYLATQALLVRHIQPAMTSAEMYFARAFPQGKDTAEVELYAASGQLCSTLHCKYQRLSERAFERLFAQHRIRTSRDVPLSPYTAPVEMQRTFTSSSQATALLPCVTPEMCPGHFEDYPAMPVAILMDGLHRLACNHAVETGNPHLRLSTCMVEAKQLAFAGEAVEFSVTRIKKESELLHYQGTAIRLGDPDTVFGRTELAYQLLENRDLVTANPIATVLHVGALAGKY